MPVSEETLRKMGEILVEEFIREAKKDFAKRGWEMRDPETGKHLADTFRVVVVNGNLEVQSSFWGLDTLIKKDIPPHKMTWMTQEYKQNNPSKFELTETERRTSTRGPLVVPMKQDDGRVLFRMAPATSNEAWVHPGVKKFLFPRRAMEKARKRWEDLWLKELLKQLEDKS